MSEVHFSDDFKRGTVVLITDRSYSVGGSQRLGVSQHSLCARRKKFCSHRTMRARIPRFQGLKRDLVRVTEERGILNRPPHISLGVQSEICVRRRALPIVSVRAMYRCLRIHPSDLYAWCPQQSSNGSKKCKMKALENKGLFKGYRS